MLRVKSQLLSWCILTIFVGWLLQGVALAHRFGGPNDPCERNSSSNRRHLSNSPNFRLSIACASRCAIRLLTYRSIFSVSPLRRSMYCLTYVGSTLVAPTPTNLLNRASPSDLCSPGPKLRRKSGRERRSDLWSRAVSIAINTFFRETLRESLSSCRRIPTAVATK